MRLFTHFSLPLYFIHEYRLLCEIKEVLTIRCYWNKRANWRLRESFEYAIIVLVNIVYCDNSYRIVKHCNAAKNLHRQQFIHNDTTTGYQTQSNTFFLIYIWRLSSAPVPNYIRHYHYTHRNYYCVASQQENKCKSANFESLEIAENKANRVANKKSIRKFRVSAHKISELFSILYWSRKYRYLKFSWRVENWRKSGELPSLQ